MSFIFLTRPCFWCLLLCLLPGGLFAQVSFEMVLGDSAFSSSESINEVRPTPDGGYIACGRTSAFGASSFDAFLLKLDVLGTVQWFHLYRPFSGPSLPTSEARSVIPTSDGGYAFCGTLLGAFGNDDVYVTKVDANGAIQWQRAYGDSGADQANSIVETSSGDFLIGGSTSSFQGMFNSNTDMYALAVSATGNLLWSRRYGRTNQDFIREVREAPDGRYLLFGYSGSNTSSNDFALLKVRQNNGNILFSQVYGGTGNDTGEGMEVDTDGGILMVGNTRSFSNSTDAFALKVDASGTNVQWCRRYRRAPNGNSERLFSISPNAGGYFIYGNIFVSAGANQQAMAMQVRSNGAVDRVMEYGGMNGEFSSTGYLTADGGMVFAGLSFSFGTSQDGYLVKIDSMGGSVCNGFTMSYNNPQETPTISPGPTAANAGTSILNLSGARISPMAPTRLLCFNLGTLDGEGLQLAMVEDQEGAWLEWGGGRPGQWTGFVVEQSIAGGAFVAVEEVMAEGHSSYRYAVPCGSSPASRFRVAARDLEGLESYSNEVLVPEAIAGTAWRLFPNPAGDQLRLLPCSSGMDAGEIWLMDGWGRVIPVLKEQTLAGEWVLKLEELPAGRYWLRIREPGMKERFYPFLHF